MQKSYTRIEELIDVYFPVDMLNPYETLIELWLRDYSIMHNLLDSTDHDLPGGLLLVLSYGIWEQTRLDFHAKPGYAGLDAEEFWQIWREEHDDNFVLSSELEAHWITLPIEHRLVKLFSIYCPS